MKRDREQNLDEHMQRIAKRLRTLAWRGTFNGRESGMRYLASCLHDDHSTATRLIFTRDTGHHTSGWLKNPDYERCWHLSTSPKPSAIVTLTPVQAEPDWATMQRWVRAFFPEHERYLWAESPKSDVGKQRGVWHWRLFCDANWQPIIPRGEVYSKEFTEVGWKSASQVWAEGGLFVSETEDGRTIESTVDPT